MLHLFKEKDRKTEYCFNIGTEQELTPDELNILKQIISDGFYLQQKPIIFLPA